MDNRGGSAPPNPAVVEHAAKHGLVDVRVFLPDLIRDLRYATKDNVTGHVLYPPGMPCLLQRATAEKLAQAQKLLREQGFGLKIWDAWRPPEVQTELFRFGQQTGRPTLFVDPREAWSFHCSGTAVDITLVDRQGREVTMPSAFDEAGPAAHADPPISDQHALQNLHTLQEAMLQSGFNIIDKEWWHFDDASFKDATTCVPAIFGQALGLRLPGLK